jgi:hypothetical protein
LLPAAEVGEAVRHVRATAPDRSVAVNC